jgi:hypothetical protein
MSRRNYIITISTISYCGSAISYKFSDFRRNPATVIGSPNFDGSYTYVTPFHVTKDLVNIIVLFTEISTACDKLNFSLKSTFLN